LSERPLRIVQLAAEVTPFAKTGGLGDVAAGLSRYLASAGHDVRIFLPFYAQLRDGPWQFTPVDFIQDVPMQLGASRLRYSAWTTKLPDSDVDVYFLDCPALFHRKAIYYGDYEDALRFAFLTLAAFESCQRMGWGPDVVHCHDWHTALAPIYLRTLFAWDRLFERTRTLLTFHNLAYQGIVPRSRIADLGLGPHVRLLDGTDLAAGRFNCLKTGVLYADTLSAVSRTFAEEIQTPEGGFGLEPWVRARRGQLHGIVNGVDYGEWNPETDPFTPHHYSAADLAGKTKMKETLLHGVGLDGDGFDGKRPAPVIGIVSRLTAQKGFDLCFEVLPRLLDRLDVRLVALGSGESRYEDFFQRLHATYPQKAFAYRGYNNELAHWIEAGADLFLMPSRFEPCGLNQMYSLHYGTPPVVRKTGGLADTVEPWNAATGRGTGFVFAPFTSDALAGALDEALRTYADKTAWKTLVQNGMAQNFSWEVQGKEYVELYRRLAF
jgi:starch synthase